MEVILSQARQGDPYRLTKWLEKNMPDKRKRSQARMIGVISDTHGLVRPEVLKAFQGVDLIVHAGDVGGPGVLEALRAVAPVTAVRGNGEKDSLSRIFQRKRRRI